MDSEYEISLAGMPVTTIVYSTIVLFAQHLLVFSIFVSPYSYLSLYHRNRTFHPGKVAFVKL
jgi:hypothetical protein